MIEQDKVYIINTNDLSKIRCLHTESHEYTAMKIADHMLGRRVALYLICRPGYCSIFLKSHIYGDMMKEAREWLDSKGI